MKESPCVECGCPHAGPHPSMHDVLTELAAVKARLTALESNHPKAKGSLAEDPYFEKFWQLYPRKAGRIDARRAWNSLTAAEAQAALIHVAVYATIWEQAPLDRRQFVKYPASWLRAKAWQDGPEEWKRIAWNGKTSTIQRALVGAHPTDEAIQQRRVDESAPDWVKAVHSCFGSALRPCIDDRLMEHYYSWCSSEDVGEPDGWAKEIDRAMTEAKALVR